MFEYSYNPLEAILDKTLEFSYDDMMKIADIAGNIWDDSEEIYAFLENYDSPFWHIWNGDHVINIEIHADLSALDKAWAKEHFKDAVDKAVRIMLESNFNKRCR